MSSEKKAKNQYISLGAKCFVALIFPLCMCILYCAFRGENFFSLYLPNCTNNDCLFYFKLTEGISSFNMPKGYFGFDESHAMFGTLAAWSPIIFIPWVTWAKIFGCSYYSLIICNITLFSVSLSLFSFLSEIKWKNLICLMIISALFPSLYIHLLICLPEAVILSFLILFSGASIRCEKSENKTPYLAIMFVTSFFLTLCRPYMIIFLLLPSYYFIKKKHVTGSVISCLILISSVVIYYLLGHFFTAEYFEPLFNLDIIKLLLEGHPKGAIRLLFSEISYMIPQIITFMGRAFKTGWTAGCQYIVAFAALIFSAIALFQKKNKDKRPLLITYSIASLSLFAAIILFLGKANEGGRHVFCYAVLGLILLSVTEINIEWIVNKSLFVILLSVFLLRGAAYPEDYDIPLPDDDLKADIEYWTTVFDNPEYTLSDNVGYENTVAWIIFDVKGDKSEIADFRELYALPKGFGISCCYPDYYVNNPDNVESRFIATVSGGNIDKLLSEDGYSEIGRTEDLVIFKMY